VNLHDLATTAEDDPRRAATAVEGPSAMRVARVLAKLEPGGAQIGAFRLSQALLRHGIESHLLVGDANRAGIRVAREHGLEPECFRDRITGLQWTPSPAFAAWLAPRLVGADLVHAHMFGGWWAAARAIPPGVPLVASEHNAINWPGPPHDDEFRDALARVDRFFAHGPAAHAYVLAQGLPEERLAVGRSAIVGADSRPLPELPARRIVYTGRLAPDKGPDVLVEALARLRAPAPAFILGEGRLRRPLERRMRELGLEQLVTFTGWQPEPGRWIAGAGVFVAPSREEAWSQSVVLAMALGTPVVATAVEGLPAVLADGRGILVEPEDPDSLAAALQDVLDGRRCPDLDDARRYAVEFTPERMAWEYAASYRRLAGGVPNGTSLPTEWPVGRGPRSR
jgi:glycosyltransferase involved in cell wall biosynthesis